MSGWDLAWSLLTLSGLLFFVAGTIGLLRLPDVFTRLHALAKADNVGLGLIVLGALLRAETVQVAAKLVLIWLLTLLTSATACNLIAGAASRSEAEPGEK